jgi:thioredoxin reductase (NADPH)
MEYPADVRIRPYLGILLVPCEIKENKGDIEVDVMDLAGRENPGGRREAHNTHVDARLAAAGLCGNTDLRNGARCLRPALHDGGCDFARGARVERARRRVDGLGYEGQETRARPTADCEVLVLGGGPAGLSAALNLARLDRSVILVDGGRGRSTHRQVNRNYLGFPQDVSARRLRQLGLRQLKKYPHVAVRPGKVEQLARAGALFLASGQFGSVTGQAVILATGVLDHYPHFPGWERYVGRSMFWCIACDGYEAKGKRVVIVGTDDSAAAEAVQMHRLTKQITVLFDSRNARVSGQARGCLADLGIELRHGKIKRVTGNGGRLTEVLTTEGEALAADAVFIVQGATPQSGLARMLGARCTAGGYICIDTEQRTSVPGLYAAGDVSRLHSHQVSAAVHEGAAAASTAHYDLCLPLLRPLRACPPPPGTAPAKVDSRGQLVTSGAP